MIDKNKEGKIEIKGEDDKNEEGCRSQEVKSSKFWVSQGGKPQAAACRAGE